MFIQITPEGVVYRNTEKERLSILLLAPFHSFYEDYETRRAGCPLGLEMIAAELVAKEFNVIFIDACLSAYNQLTKQEDGTVRYGLTDEQLKSTLSHYQPDIVGITSLFSNQSHNVELVTKIVREVYPNTIIVEGGGHASGAVDEVLNSADIVVRSEGIITFTKLCEAIENKQDYHSLNGISYLNEEGTIIHSPNQKFLQDLDILAPRLLEMPLHPMYDTEEHSGGSRKTTEGRHIYLMTSLGCPMHCEFCLSDLMSGPKTRFFSLERIEKDIQRFKEKGVTEIIIEDDQFLEDIPRALRVMDILKKYELFWFEEGGISLFKLMKTNYKQLIDKMANSFCYRFYLAIESANPKSLRESKKPTINTNAIYAEETISYIRDKKIETVGGFMIGFKTNGYEETLEDMERTISYAKRLKKAGLTYVMLFIYTALPGTKVFSSLKHLLTSYSSHERSSFPVGGLTPTELTDKRIEWLLEINKEQQTLAHKKKNWGL